MHDTGMFTVKEINRLKILQDVIDRNLRPGQAAEMLGITPRHCSRLLKRYRQSGPLGMNNQSRGRTGNRLLPASLTDQALNIIRERYADFGPTLAREKLAENHGIVLGKETLRRLMIKTGLWVPRKQRAPKIQQPRYRRACCGELIQIDGCDHHWFENRAPACTALDCLLTAIVPRKTSLTMAAGSAAAAPAPIPCITLRHKSNSISRANEQPTAANENIATPNNKTGLRP